MKYSFEEKKRCICIASAVIFVVIAGIVYFCGHNSFAGYTALTGEDKTFEGNASCDSGGSKMKLSDENDSEHDNSEDSSSIQSNAPATMPEVVIVHVCGAVTSPGIYEVGGNRRVSDAIDAAGGFLDTADRGYLNLARELCDGEKLVVYTRKETKKIAKTEESEHEIANPEASETCDKANTEDIGSNVNQVNINTALAEELMTLPGIGQSKADAIIAFRESNGGFSSIDELMLIPGIKEGVYSKIENYIVVK